MKIKIFNSMMIIMLLVPIIQLKNTKFIRNDLGDDNILLGEITISNNNDDNEADECSVIGGGGIIEEPGTGDGSGYNNFSFATAYDTGVGNLNIYYAPGTTARYYKIVSNKTQYMKISSNSSAWYQIAAYDENCNPISYYYDNNWNVQNTNISTDMTLYIEQGKTYYFIFSIVLSLNEITIPINITLNNEYLSPINELVINMCSVTENKKLYYIDSTNGVFSNYIQTAVNEWNKLGSVEILPYISTYGNIKRVEIVMADLEPGTAGCYTYRNGVKKQIIEINTDFINIYNDGLHLKTIMHELGHALKLNDFPKEIENSSNIMIKGPKEYVRLGPADIGAYRYNWN